MELAFLASPNFPIPFLHPHSSNPNFYPHLGSKFNPIRRTKTPLKSKLFSTPSSVSVDCSTNHVPPVIQPESVPDEETANEKFDWHSQWYPLMPECDLDKKAPHAFKVLGIDVVVWWDRNEHSWKVFDDMCPHRLAPLSEGRIDGQGRLQCVYHGWCFDGSGKCKLVPQASVQGPPVHANKRACVAAYPTIVHHGIVWFWPNLDSKYKDIFETKKPPLIPEMDDPSFTKMLGVRDFPFGYEVLMENVMDPAHVPYSHFDLVLTQPPKVKLDREGGRPLKITVDGLHIDGYDASIEYGHGKLAAPCVFSIHARGMTVAATKKSRRTAFVFLCIPISPGNSRLIWAFPRDFSLWVNQVVPRWFFHLGLNLVFDSDLHLLHVEERKIREIGGNANWQKTCFMPTKSDALVVGFRKWLTKYGGGGVDWRGKYATQADLPATPPREQLMDRYWTHVVNCSSCNGAYKNFKALEAFLLAVSSGLIAVVSATKDGMMLASSRTRIVIFAILCFTASRWLARFAYTRFRYRGDYNHSSPPKRLFNLSKVVGVAV